MLMLGVISPFVNGQFHVLWQGGFEIHPFFLGGMLKPQCFGMKCLTRQKGKTILDKLPVLGKGGSFKYVIPTVAGIVKQSMSNKF